MPYGKVMIFQPITLHGAILHRIRTQEVQARAQKQYGSITKDSPWMSDLGRRLNQLLDENASSRSKFGKLTLLADEIASAVAPHAGCRDNCAACCHISVAISDHEAASIGAKVGLVPHRPPPNQEGEDLAKRYFRLPCPFVQDGRCSIYAHRPIACRLHFTLDKDAYFCQTTLEPDQSSVPNVDLTLFWHAYAMLSIQLDTRFGDIRQFFPSGLAARSTRKELQNDTDDD